MKWNEHPTREHIDVVRAELSVLKKHLREHHLLKNTAAAHRLVLIERELNDVENICRQRLGYTKGGPVNDNISYVKE